MRTCARLVATTAAVAYHSGRSRLSLWERIAAAVNAEDAWPDGKLELRGLRILKERSCSHSGRVRRKNDLMTPFTSTDSTPRMAAMRTVSAASRSERRPLATPMRCQIKPKSPSSVAA